jgi:subtilisin family serine protease
LAVDVWKVDIISMSFGWPTRDFDDYDKLEAAIDHANTQRVLMFAAASNSGGRQGRSYPARSPNVICIHSTDTEGNASKFSPTASPDDMNLATVGESIKSAWPYYLRVEESNHLGVTYKSGTSYATAVAAGIGAFLLHYARLHLPEEAYILKRRDRMMALLKRVAQRGENYQPRDGYYYIELSLSPENLFGQDKEWIDYEIGRILKS